MSKWIKLALLLAVMILLLLAAWRIIRGTGQILLGSKDSGEADPMFAEETVLPTRPPQPDAEETQTPHDTLDDYVPETETPVDKTAAELIDEARQN